MKFFLLTAAHRPAVFSSIAYEDDNSKLGLTLNLRRIPADKIESAQAQTRNASC